jgi:hypothetical protein
MTHMQQLTFLILNHCLERQHDYNAITWDISPILLPKQPELGGQCIYQSM